MRTDQTTLHRLLLLLVQELSKAVHWTGPSLHHTPYIHLLHTNSTITACVFTQEAGSYTEDSATVSMPNLKANFRSHKRRCNNCCASSLRAEVTRCRGEYMGSLGLVWGHRAMNLRAATLHAIPGVSCK